MGNFNLIEHYRNISSSLFSEYKLSSAYGHRGTKGQIREGVLLKTLKAMAPDDVHICKGEICDSSGKRSPEFDIIISHQSTAIKLFSSAINRVIPIETVLGVIEVKSTLAKDSIVKFNSDLKELNSFERFYIPTDLYKYFGDITGNKEYALFSGKPIRPTDNIKGITRIVGGIFAFDAPKIDTVNKWLKELKSEVNFGYICVLNSFFAVYNISNHNWEITELGQDTFAAFARIYIELVDSHERESNLKCDSARYIEFAF